MPKISVIVPVYNTEKYLHRCVDSILAQTFTDFELLLIDDGSTDGSGAICDEYAQKDSRVRVFHKENGGVSSARNLGLDNARGEWISFVDSDDWIEYSSIQNLINQGDADLIIGSVSIEPQGNIRNLSSKEKIEGDELNRILTTEINNFVISSPFAKLYKNKIIKENSLRFNEELCLGEDNVFVKSYLIYALSLRCVNKICYHYQDIGDDFYYKYNKSFLPILNYYYEISAIYKILEKEKSIVIPKQGVVGLVYNFVCTSLESQGVDDLEHICTFLTDESVQEILSKRKSLHIKNMLFLSHIFNGYVLFAYYRIVLIIKAFLQRK